MSRRLLLAALALAGVAPSSAAADTRIAVVDRPTMLSAYGPGLLFSVRNPRTDRFRLWFARQGGRAKPLPLRDRAAPFDADLGPGTHGNLLAVYSRCATEPVLDPADNDSPPDYTMARGCDLFQFDLATGRERRLVVSSPKASEVLPTVWGNSVAFVRDGLTTIALTAPAWEGPRPYWAALCQGDEAGCPHRDGLMRRTAAGKTQRAPLGPHDLWQARGGGVTYVLRDSSVWRTCNDVESAQPPPTCRILATTPRYRP